MSINILALETSSPLVGELSNQSYIGETEGGILTSESDKKTPPPTPSRKGRGEEKKIFKMRKFYICISLLLAPWHNACAEDLITIPSHPSVAITSNFNGASLSIFGAIERGQYTPRNTEYDVVVAVHGPEKSVSIAEKKAFGIFYINGKPQDFTNVPSYLAYISNRPIADFATPQVRSKLQLGLDFVPFTPVSPTVTHTAEYKNALIRLNKQDGLFVELTDGVQFFTPTLFRTQVTLPDNAAAGVYAVDTYVFSAGQMVGRNQNYFHLYKVGFEQWLFNAAQEEPVVYGLSSIVLALFMGWFGAVTFRRG